MEITQTVQDRMALVQRALAQDPNMRPTKIAEVTGIPRTSVNRYLKQLRPINRGSQSISKQESPMSDIQRREAEYKYVALNQKYREALDIIEEQRSMLSAVASVGDTPDYSPIVINRGKKREAVPVIVASDWHIEEQVKAEVTNGKNEYNLEIAERSVAQFFSNACELIHQCKRDSKINTVVLAILGDIINGVLRDEDLQTNQQTSIEALSTARSLIYTGIRQLVEETKCNIRVICCVGNHGRLTSKIYPSNQVRNNLEYLMYKMLQRDFRDVPNVNVIISEAEYYIQDIFGVRVRFHHGHIFKFNGGIGGLSVPVLRKISQLNLIEKADLDVCGHFHSMQIFNNCILNGSLVGANGYSMHLGIPYEPPRQVFFLVDSKYGRSVVAPIFIDRDVKKEAINKI